MRLAIYALLCLCFAVVPEAQADDKTTFTIGVEDYRNFLPYSEYKEGVYGGLGKDILEAFAKRQGYTFIYKAYPLKRRDQLFVEGAVDLAFPDNPNWVADLKKSLRISYAPMLAFTDGVLVQPKDIGRGLARLKVLGIPLGFTPYPYQQLMTQGALRIEESGNYDGLYEKLIMRRVDGAYMNTRIARYYWTRIKGYGELPVMYDPDLPHASGQWYLSSHKYPRLIEEFKKFMAANHELIEDMKKHYGFESSDDQ